MSEEKRETQVNVRLTKVEKAKLTKVAFKKGYASLSAFIRCSAIKMAEGGSISQ